MIIINSGICAILQRVTLLLNRRDLLDFQGRLIFGTTTFGDANIFFCRAAAQRGPWPSQS
jgi:hypothetical protein